MNVLKKILGVSALLAILNLIYVNTSFIGFAEQEADQYLQAQKVAQADVLYVSESSNFSPENSNDTNTRKLSQYLSDYFPDMVFESINMPAAHAGIYKQVLEAIPEENEIKTVIIAVNMRSFSASWINSHLETPLNKSAVFYNNRPPLLNRFLMSLNAYDNSREIERERAMFASWEKESLPYPAPRNSVTNWTAQEKWGDWQHPKRQLADHYIKQYAYQLHETNRRVKDFTQIAEMAENRGWNIVFSILAENTEEAEQLVGAELKELMRQNKSWLIEYFTNEYESITIIDNMELLGSDEFTEKDFPSEHYYESGRRKIAKNIAQNLNEHL